MAFSHTKKSAKLQTQEEVAFFFHSLEKEIVRAGARQRSRGNAAHPDHVQLSIENTAGESHRATNRPVNMATRGRQFP
jgi:hypothetical protein